MKPTFPEEVKYLKMVIQQLTAALSQYDKSVDEYKQDYYDTKKYLASYWNELDSMERFSNERSIDSIESVGNLTLAMRNKVQKLLDSPYFARIDFRFDGDEEAEAVYIGTFSFSDHQRRMLIYDWRAPIANMYYEYQTGPASYEAPAGTIHGDILRKRQIKVKQGELEYVLESSLNIDDDILRKELSATSDKKMKNIITTIQKEQNQIIRNDRADVLIIQGVAGSGKTSIALHRVAFLLYRHKDYLTARDIAIISPNKVFADYISNVLPELGEEPLLELSFTEIAQEILADTISFERYAVHAEDRSPEWLARLAFKSAPDLPQQLDDYLGEVGKRYFEPIDCTFGGTAIAASYIRKRYQVHRQLPILQRLPAIANDILEMLNAESFREAKLPPKSEIMRKLRGMMKMSGTLALYRDFYHYMNVPELFVPPTANTLEWPDVFPYLYLYLAVEGSAEQSSVQHLVIDEMQDYTPIQYAVINQLFRCQKTILGDIGQSVLPGNICSADIFRQIFGKTTFVKLTKSYRSTYEIIEFARFIKNDQEIEPVERHGDDPDLVGCVSPADEFTVIQKKLATFLTSSYTTMGVLCKDLQQAKALYNRLSSQYPVHFLGYDSTHFENGIHITSIPLSKGLEFDEVVVPYVSAEYHDTDFDRNLLYIACTRAMHKLSLTYCGTVTELLSLIN